MNKLWIVTMETFLRQIKSWSFVLLIIGPFLMFGISIGAGYMGAQSNQGADKIAVISNQPQLRDSFIKSNKDDVNKSVIDKKTATKKMNHNKLAGYLELEIVSGKVSAHYTGTTSLGTGTKSRINSYLMQTQQQLNLANYK